MILRAYSNPGWELINEIGWGTWTNDYKVVRKYMKLSLDRPTIRLLANFALKRVADLYRVIDDYQKTHERLKIGSDDGLNDVLYHIVGLGEDEWKQAVTSPLLIELRYRADYGTTEGYKESFAYCFQT